MNAPLSRDLARFHDGNAEGIGPGRLWSLWDMLKVNGTAFYGATTALNRLEVLFWEIRKDGGGEEWKEKITSHDDMETFTGPAIELRGQLEILGAKFTIISVDAFCRLVNGGDCSYEQANEHVRDINRRLRDELNSVTIFAIGQTEALLYDPVAPHFGSDVATKFPSAQYEIEEAGKCLSVGRSTAAAFHSIRCVEAGIRAVSRCLSIPDPTRGADRSWFNLLKAIKQEIDHRWPPSLIKSGDAETLDLAYAALAGMQNPWRNSTMHLDQVYTLEDAKHVFEIVGGFMRKLASRMDENGLPPA
jgi:hypothetical protein